MRDYVKKCIKDLKLSGKSRICINNVGCLDCCDEGLVIVIYFEEVWYIYVDKDDVDEIIDEYFVNGCIVECLRI